MTDKDLPPLPAEADDSGAVSLMEVEPSPVQDTPTEYKDSYFAAAAGDRSPDREHEGIRRTNTLGLGNHGAAWYCECCTSLPHPLPHPLTNDAVTRIQKYSSYAFAVVSAFHVANTALIPLATRSVAESNRYLLLTRPYYQSTITEPLLVGIPLVAHVASGIALRLYRRRQALKRYGAETRLDKRSIPWPALSGTSALGYALVPLAAFHVWTTRLLPLYLHGDNSLISLSYIAHGFAAHPVLSFAGFSALIAVGTWHTVWGAAKWLGLTPAQVSLQDDHRDLTRKRRWYGVNAVAAAVAGLWLSGGLGVVGRGAKTVGWIGKEFDELYKYVPLMGAAQ